MQAYVAAAVRACPCGSHADATCHGIQCGPVDIGDGRWTTWLRPPGFSFRHSQSIFPLSISFFLAFDVVRYASSLIFVFHSPLTLLVLFRHVGLKRANPLMYLRCRRRAPISSFSPFILVCRSLKTLFLSFFTSCQPTETHADASYRAAVCISQTLLR